MSPAKTTGNYYIYGSSTKTQYAANAGIFTDTSGIAARTCTTDSCNNPATFNPNAAATALLSAAFMAAAVIFA